MIIFKDIVTGDELFTDIYKYKEEKGVFYVVEGKYKTETAGSIDEALIGGNASAEAQPEEATADSAAVTGIDVILANRLVETGFGSKKEYQSYLKKYMGKVVSHLEEKNPGRVGEFKSQMSAAVKELLGKFSDLQFFMGESCNPEAMHVVCYHEGETPFLVFFKDGLEEEKV